MPEHHMVAAGDSMAIASPSHGPFRSKTTPTKKHHDRPGEKPLSVSLDRAEKGEKKNVSHVPCKFFRQSICQAGDKCPFSHELDSQSQAVCKYYQKGNCKFGAKCALAHINADGRQVNKKLPKEAKDGASRRKEKIRDDGGDTLELSPQHSRTKTGSASSQASDTTVVDSSVQMASRILSKYSGSVPSPAPSSTTPKLPAPQPLHLAPAPQSSNSSPRINFNAKPFVVRSLSSSLPQSPGNQRPLASLGSLSIGANNAPPNGIVMSPPQGHIGLQASSWTSYRSLFEGSAITDDEDDTVEEDNLLEEEGFEEQLVPSTLTDLLTPLERERRNSRNSAQKSGRVFSSPSVVSAPFGFGARRLSTGSSSSSHEILSSSAPLQDLWSPRPRNQVFPLQRPYEQQEDFDSGALPKAPIGTQYGHEPPIEMDGAYQPFQQFNRAIAR